MSRFSFRAWDAIEKHMLPVFDIRAANITYALHDKELILMQLTGLSDKNGKMIFEGDVIDFETVWDRHVIGVIVWEADSSCFIMEPHDNDDDIHYGLHADLAKESYEIIGNVHEHPELVK